MPRRVDHTPFTEDHLLAAEVVNVHISTASVVLGYLIARKLFGATAELIAAIVLAVFPNLVFQVASIQLETTFIFWILAALWILVGHDWSSGLPSTKAAHRVRPRARRVGARATVLGVVRRRRRHRRVGSRRRLAPLVARAPYPS